MSDNLNASGLTETDLHAYADNQLAVARREMGNVSLDAEGEYGAAWQVPVRDNQQDRVELQQVLQQVGRLPHRYLDYRHNYASNIDNTQGEAAGAG